MLDKDLTLEWESISMKHGHAGSNVTYKAAAREVVFSTRCTRKRMPFLPLYATTENEERLSVPPEITREKELRAYVREQRPHWLKREPEEDLEEDLGEALGQETKDMTIKFPPEDPWKPEPPFLVRPLTERLCLKTESKSLVDGHAGTDVYYDPDTREVVKKLWVMQEAFLDPQTGKMRYYSRKEEEHTPIPPEITTHWELWEYVQKKMIL